MIEKSLKSLEFDKICKKLSDLCVFEENKNAMLNLKPKNDIDEVKQNLLYTNTVANYIIKYSSPSLDSANGAKNAVLHSEKGAMLSIGEILLVGRMYRNFSRIKKWYMQYEKSDDCLDWQIGSIIENTALEEEIQRVVIGENQLADNASDGLYSVRRQIKQTESAVREKMDNIIRSQTYQKYLQEAVVTIRQNKFVVPVKAEYKNEIQGIIHDVSSSGSTYFIEPAAIAQLNTKVMQLYNQEQDEINKILLKFSQIIASSAEMFYESFEKIVFIDEIIAKAKFAISYDGIMPKINNELKFNLIKAKHPLLDKTTAVAIDLSLGFDYDTLIITGPNTGGKTVSLKTAGLLCSMACSGMLIPAHEESSVCVFENILVDIGDEQSIQQSLSTFSGHIKNIATILEKANDKTLVLMDEMGAGTDPAEGAALAISIIEALRNKGAKIMSTTHYGELKIFALETNGVQNASCEFNVETLRPTYKILVGVPGKSNAFHISSKLGIDSDIISRAKTHLSNEDKKLNQVFSQLEDMRKELLEKQQEIETLKDYANITMKKAQSKSDEILQKALEEAKLITNNAKNNVQKIQDEAYKLADELKVIQKQENVSAQERLRKARDIARNQTSKLISETEVDEPAPSYTPLTSVKKGDKVIIASLNKQAVVQNPPSSNGMVDVVAGVIKTKVHISGLYADISAKKQQQSTTRTVRKSGGKSVNVSRTASTEINLLGMNVDEALLEVDRFLDNCVMNKLHTAYIIHGKGTGALRAGIHAHLKRHPQVSFYRIGAYGEGESGVTVVELK